MIKLKKKSVFNYRGSSYTVVGYHADGSMTATSLESPWQFFKFTVDQQNLIEVKL